MAYTVKGAAFRYNGAIDVSDCKTSLEVMQKSGLDWNVQKCRVFAEMTPNEEYEKPNSRDNFLLNLGGDKVNLSVVPNSYGIYRTDYNIPLGLVKERYEPVQNVDAFKFFDEAVGLDEALYQTAGYFGNGERIFVSAKLPDDIYIKNRDVVENYLVFTSSHDGTSGVKILFTNIRVICQNTLNAAIRDASNYVSFRHTKSVHSNIDIAKEILGICKTKRETAANIYSLLANCPVNDNAALDIFGSIVLSDNEIATLKSTGHTIKEVANRYWFAIDAAKISTQKVNILENMVRYYHTGPGQKEFEGTGWGVVNAVSGYYCNIDNSEGVKRMDSLLYGDKNNKINKAMLSALSMAG